MLAVGLDTIYFPPWMLNAGMFGGYQDMISIYITICLYNEQYDYIYIQVYYIYKCIIIYTSVLSYIQVYSIQVYITTT